MPARHRQKPSRYATRPERYLRPEHRAWGVLFRFGTAPPRPFRAEPRSGQISAMWLRCGRQPLALPAIAIWKCRPWNCGCAGPGVLARSSRPKRRRSASPRVAARPKKPVPTRYRLPWRKGLDGLLHQSAQPAAGESCRRGSILWGRAECRRGTARIIPPVPARNRWKSLPTQAGQPRSATGAPTRSAGEEIDRPPQNNPFRLGTGYSVIPLRTGHQLSFRRYPRRTARRFSAVMTKRRRCR